VVSESHGGRRCGGAAARLAHCHFGRGRPYSRVGERQEAEEQFADARLRDGSPRICEKRSRHRGLFVGARGRRAVTNTGFCSENRRASPQFSCDGMSRRPMMLYIAHPLLACRVCHAFATIDKSDKTNDSKKGDLYA